LTACSRNRIERRAHRQRLRVDLHVQERGPPGGQRALECRLELVRPHHGLAVRAICTGERREIGIDEIRS
jgi:hypothetical protein